MVLSLSKLYEKKIEEDIHPFSPVVGLGSYTEFADSSRLWGNWGHSPLEEKQRK